jgi:hypothetical protein
MQIGYWESPMEGDHWEEQDVGVWIILKWFLGLGGMEWIDLTP